MTIERPPSVARAKALLALAAAALGNPSPVAPQLRRARRLARKALEAMAELGPRGWPKKAQRERAT